jgi:hypothetical protein
MFSFHKKLVVFGDSFFSCEGPNSITELLSSSLKVPMKNTARSGSAIQYSVVEFLKYVESKDYHKDDTILFGLTSPERIYTYDIPNLSFGVCAVKGSGYSNEGFEPSHRRWLDENLLHCVWAAEKIYHPDINTETIRTLLFLRGWASIIPNKIIVLSPFSAQSILEGNSISRFIEQTSNFFPLVLKDQGPLLYDLSIDEFESDELFTRAAFREDKRLNHLTLENRQVVAKALHQLIESEKVEDYFSIIATAKKRIITESHVPLDQYGFQ